MPLSPSQRRPVPPTWLMLLVVFAVFVYWAGNEPPAPEPEPATAAAEPIKPFPIQVGPSFEAKGFALTQIVHSQTNQNGGLFNLQGVVRCLSPKTWHELRLELQFIDRFDRPLEAATFDLWRHPTLGAGQGDDLPFSLVRGYPDLAVQARLNIVDRDTRENAARANAAGPTALVRQARFAMGLTPSLAGALLNAAVFRDDLARHTTQPTPPARRHQPQETRPVGGCDDLRFDLREISQVTEETTSVWLAVEHRGQAPITAGRLRLRALDSAGRVLAQDMVVLAQPGAPHLASKGRRLLHARLKVQKPVEAWALDVVSLRRQSPPVAKH